MKLVCSILLLLSQPVLAAPQSEKKATVTIRPGPIDGAWKQLTLSCSKGGPTTEGIKAMKNMGHDHKVLTVISGTRAKTFYWQISNAGLARCESWIGEKWEFKKGQVTVSGTRGERRAIGSHPGCVGLIDRGDPRTHELKIERNKFTLTFSNQGNDWNSKNFCYEEGARLVVEYERVW